MAAAYAVVDARDHGVCRACSWLDSGFVCREPKPLKPYGWMDPAREHHHIRKRSTHPELRTDSANIIVLCAKHHADVEAKRLRIIGTNADGPLEFTRA